MATLERGYCRTVGRWAVRWVLLISTVCTAAAWGQPGTLLGLAVGQEPVSPFRDQLTLLSVDPISGRRAILGGVLLDTNVGGKFTVSALDPSNHRFFTHSDDQPPQLIALDTMTGQLVAHPGLSHAVSALEFDVATSTLLGLGVDQESVEPFADQLTLYGIDPLSGQQTILGSVVLDANVGGTFQVSALDPSSHRFFTHSDDQPPQLIVLDTVTGQLVAHPGLSHAVSALEFDVAMSTLLGLGVDQEPVEPFADQLTLYGIDPVSGQQTILGSEVLDANIGGKFQVSALDPGGHRFFTHSDDQPPQLIVLDTVTGQLVAQPVLSDDVSALEFDASSSVTPTTTPLPPLSNTPTQSPSPSTAPTNASTGTPTAVPPPIPTPTPIESPGTCVGDCDGSGDVTVNEIVTLVNIALGGSDSAVCADGIPVGATADITLIVQAVGNALTECAPPTPPPIPVIRTTMGDGGRRGTT